MAEKLTVGLFGDSTGAKVTLRQDDIIATVGNKRRLASGNYEDISTTVFLRNGSQWTVDVPQPTFDNQW